MIKKFFVVLVFILTVLLLVNSANAAFYTVSNSTDVDTIAKMVSGKSPIKNSKFIKNGDTVKFKEGNYYNLHLNVKKSITITNVKKAKVRFIGNNSGIAINLTNKNKKVNINGVVIRNYSYGIKGKIKSGKITKNVFYKNEKYGIYIKSSKTIVSKNKFIQNANGLYLIGNKNIVSYNKVNKGSSYLDAMLVRGNNNSIMKNKFNTPFSNPIRVEGNKNKITKNTINKGLSGIFTGGTKNLISYNKVYNIKHSAIYVAGDNSKIRYNTVKNSESGLCVMGKLNSISFNKIYKNKIGIEYIKGNNLLKNKFLNNNKKTKLWKLEDLGEI